MLSFVGLIIQLGIFSLFSEGNNAIVFDKIIFYFLLYAVYIFIITGLSVLVSSWLKQSNTSLLLQIASWVILMIVLPKIMASAGAKLYPMEHQYQFKKALREDRDKGINGHNPDDERSKAFQDSLLKHYKVDTLADLPVNADGLIMQADEEYANMVYDKHFTRIRNTITKQNSISKYASLVNPFLAIRNASMAVSQSDYDSQLNLFADAELYRRYLIKELNTKMAYGGSKTDDWDWKVDDSYWQTVKDFDYPKASLYKSIHHCLLEISALAIWIVVIILSVFITSKKINVL